MMYHAFLLGVALSPLFRGPATRSPAIVAIAPPPSADQDGARGAAELSAAAPRSLTTYEKLYIILSLKVIIAS